MESSTGSSEESWRSPASLQIKPTTNVQMLTCFGLRMLIVNSIIIYLLPLHTGSRRPAASTLVPVSVRVLISISRYIFDAITMESCVFRVIQSSNICPLKDL